MTDLVVRSCGPRTSFQDAGRFGAQRYGVSNSGAMDGLARATANVLVGNDPGAAAVECMLLGASFVCEDGSARVAVAGAPCAVHLDGRPVPAGTTITLRSGQTLALGPMQAGVYAYLAVSGGFAIAPQLGSLSLHQRASLGGYEGRALRAGDRIPLNSAGPSDAPLVTLPPVPLEPDAAIRVILGPQDDHFTASGLATFLGASYTISQDADRMGYRLAGPKVEHSSGYNIVSDGIVSGSVQVPGSGEPIIMMADRQTTGGYPKIATVISADLRLVAQRRPGAPVRFVVVDMAQAQQAARDRAGIVGALPGRTVQVRGGLPPLEEMLALNLAGAAVDALAPEHT